MNPQDPNHAALKNPLAVMQPGERVIFNIKRHPIGIVGMYIATGLILVVLGVVAFGLAPQYITTVSRSQVLTVGGLGFLIMAAIILIFLLISNIVYWGNRWILTSDSITQINQNSLFDKQMSQLSLANLEDVVAEQNGLLANIFNYGTVKAETAGERAKFTFRYCPKPRYYAQQVLQARENFEQEVRLHGGASRSNYPLPNQGVKANTNPQDTQPPPQA